MEFRKATRKKSKLRLAMFGPSGAGKTIGALRIATGIANKISSKILMIDTQWGQSELYADDFDFDIEIVEDKSIEALIKVMNLAKNLKYEIIIIDTFSHCWNNLVEEINDIANKSLSGNSWAAWSKGTPKMKKLIDYIQSYPGHIIATMRSKIEYVIELNAKGKSVPKQIGTIPEAGKNIEYDFTFLIQVDKDHDANIIKGIGEYQDMIINLIDEIFGEGLIDWLNKGKDAPIKEETIKELLSQIEDKQEKIEFVKNAKAVNSITDKYLREKGINELKASINLYLHEMQWQSNDEKINNLTNKIDTAINDAEKTLNK